MPQPKRKKTARYWRRHPKEVAEIISSIGPDQLQRLNEMLADAVTELTTPSEKEK